MKKCIMLYIVCLISTMQAAYALEVFEMDHYSISSGLVSGTNTGIYNTGPALQLYFFTYALNEYDITRLFFELDLTPWYAQNIPVSAIKKVELSLGTDNPSSIPALVNFYDMVTSLDGVLSASQSQYYADTNLIQPDIEVDDNAKNITFVLTDTNLHFFTDDLVNNDQWSGFSLRLSDEMYFSGSVDFYHWYPPYVMPDASLLPTFRIYYEPSSATGTIPEPSSIILILFGIIGLYHRRTISK